MRESTCALSAVAALRAGDVMEPATLTVGEQESLASAWEMLARSECRYLPVVRGGRVVGILDDHAVVCARSTRSLDGRQRQVGEFSRIARLVSMDTPLGSLLPSLFDADGVVVVVDQGRAVGVLACEHIARVLAGALGGLGSGRPAAEPVEIGLAGVDEVPLTACVGAVEPAREA